MGPGYGGDTEEIHLAHPVTVELDALQTFDDFYSLLLKITAEIVRAHAEGACEFCLHNAEKNASPLVSSLLNDCIARSRGSLIAPFGSDDVMMPERIAVQVAYMRDKPEVGICAGNIEMIDSNGTIIDTLTRE